MIVSLIDVAVIIFSLGIDTIDPIKDGTFVGANVVGIVLFGDTVSLLKIIVLTEDSAVSNAVPEVSV